MDKNIGSPATTLEILRKYDISPSKSLGQNFLIDNNILHKIIMAGQVDENDHVVEIGPGLGALTQCLAKAAGKVTVIEKDGRLIPVLKEILQHYNNITYIEEDVLKIDWNQIVEKEKKPKIIANLPYYITTPIIMGLLEENVPCKLMVFMIQKEVAERMVAKPGGKDYGVLSVAVQYYAKPEIIGLVPPTVFIPRPNVDSAIIKLNIYPEPVIKVLNREIFFKTVKAVFHQRRKTILNSLKGYPGFNFTKAEVQEVLKNAGIDPNLRGEKLGLEDLGRLSDEICGLLN